MQAQARKVTPLSLRRAMDCITHAAVPQRLSRCALLVEHELVLACGVNVGLFSIAVHELPVGEFGGCPRFSDAQRPVALLDLDRVSVFRDLVVAATPTHSVLLPDGREGAIRLHVVGVVPEEPHPAFAEIRLQNLGVLHAHFNLQTSRQRLKGTLRPA